MQEVFVKALEALRRGSAPDRWDAWLTRVTLNACRDRHRAGWWMRFWRRSEPFEGLPTPAPGPAPDEAAAQAEAARRAWTAFQGLSRRQREVLVLRYVEGYTTDEAAATLGVDGGSVKRHLYRAITRLRAAMGESR